MRFLLVASFPDSLIKFRGPLLDSLLSQGIDVHVVGPDLGVDSTMRQVLEGKGLHVHEIPLRRTGMNPLADIVTLLNLYRVMRRVRPTHVLSYTIKPVIYGSLAAWLAKVPRRFALITGLGYAFVGGSKVGVFRRSIRRLAQRLYALALRNVDRVFFQNPDDQTLFRDIGILTARTPSSILNGSGVDTSEFSVAPHSPGMSFLLIARLLGDKGVREYVKAAQRVKAVNKDVRFLLVGWIDENPDAISQIELDQWVKEGWVDFLGRLTDVRPAIAASNVYVLPSYREGTPRTVLEAMAMGRPIITTDAPGCRETVLDGENGFLVPVQSVEHLELAMLRFINKPELAVTMGLKSRHMAETKFDVHKVNKKMIREMGL